MRNLIAATLALGVATPVTGQNVIVPTDRTTDIEVGCQVRGLDPNGDGFLAIRSGPGTEYPQIGSLRNGDAAFIAAGARGRWLYVENGAINGNRANFRGWIYDAWCSFYP